MDKTGLLHLFTLASFRQFIKVLAVIFIGEVVVMFLISALLPDKLSLAINILDAFILTIIVSPFLWWLIIRPIHKEAEEAIYDSEGRYRLLFEGNPHPMWVYDLETLKFLDVNDVAISHYGYSREEFLNMTIKDIRPPEDIPALLDNIVRVTTGLDKAGVWRHKKKDGTTIYIEITSHTLDFEGRRSEVVLANDITDRLQKDAELQESESRFRSLVEESLVGVYLIQDGIFVYVNPKLAETLGCAQSEIISRSPLDFTIKEDHALVIENIRKRIQGEVKSINYTVRAKRKDGTVIDIEVYGARISYKGKPAIIGTVIDITERKRAEEALKRSEEHFRLLIESSPDCICHISLDGIFMDMNRSGCVINELDGPEEVIGKDCTANIVENREAMEEAIGQAARGRNVSIQYKSVTKSGREVWWDSKIIPLMDTAGTVRSILRMSRDITEHKKADDEIKKTVSLLNATLESTADGILVVDRAGGMVSFNQKFIEMWRIPQDIIATQDDNLALGFVLDQLEKPEIFLNKVRDLYAKPEMESFDVLEFKDGRVFERYSKPQKIGDKIVGRVWSFRDVTERRQVERRVATEHAITRILIEFTTLDEAALKILQSICESLEWDLGEFWIVDEHTNVLRCVNIWHRPDRDFPDFEKVSKEITFPMGVGLPGRVWASSKPAWIPDVTRDENFPRAPFAKKDGLHGGFAFPIRIGDKVVAILGFLSSEIRQPDNAMMEMFSSIGNTIGQFIKDKEYEQELEAIAEVTTALRTAMSRAEMPQIILD